MACLAALISSLVAGRLGARADAPGGARALLSRYDPGLGAPACRDLGASCRTDDDAIAGVAGFEPRAPNTVDDCADRSGAARGGRDEAVDRLLVRATDGGTMTAGGSLQVHVTVSQAADVSSRSKPDAKETLHVYYAAESYGERGAALVDRNPPGSPVPV